MVQVEVAGTPCTGLAVACASCHPIVHWERRHHKKREPFGSGFREPLRAGKTFDKDSHQDVSISLHILGVNQKLC